MVGVCVIIHNGTVEVVMFDRGSKELYEEWDGNCSSNN